MTFELLMASPMIRARLLCPMYTGTAMPEMMPRIARDQEELHEAESGIPSSSEHKILPESTERNISKIRENSHSPVVFCFAGWLPG